MNGRGSWKLRASPMCVRRCAGSPSSAWPAKRTLPVSLCSVPQTQLTSVLLPEPLGPIRPSRSPSVHVEVDAVQRDEAAEALADAFDLQQRGRLMRPAPRCAFARQRSSTRPTMPSGATMTKATSSTPTISRLTAEEMVTVAICCSEPSRMAPISGPTQLVVPPIIGMAMELTA